MGRHKQQAEAGSKRRTRHTFQSKRDKRRGGGLSSPLAHALFISLSLSLSHLVPDRLHLQPSNSLQLLGVCDERDFDSLGEIVDVPSLREVDSERVGAGAGEAPVEEDRVAGEGGGRESTEPGEDGSFGGGRRDRRRGLRVEEESVGKAGVGRDLVEVVEIERVGGVVERRGRGKGHVRSEGRGGGGGGGRRRGGAFYLVEKKA